MAGTGAPSSGNHGHVSWLHMLMEIRYESLPPPKQSSWYDVLGSSHSSAIAGDISWSDVMTPNVMSAPRRRNSHAIIIKDKVTQSDARFLNAHPLADEKETLPASSIFNITGTEDSDSYSSDSEDAEKTKLASPTAGAGGSAGAPAPGAPPTTPAASAPAVAAAGTTSGAPGAPAAAAAKPAAERPKEIVEDGAIYQLEGGDYILKWGTLDKLVEKMTSDLTADIPLTNTVLLTYRSHTTPLALFQKLMKRFSLPVPAAMPTHEIDTWKSKVLLPVRLRVYVAVKLWVVNHFYDFKNDKELRQALIEFTSKLLPDANMHQASEQLAKIIKKKDMPIEGPTWGGGNEFSPQAPGVKIPKPLITQELWGRGEKPLDLTRLPAEEMARQLTLIEAELFRTIPPWELQGQGWVKADKATRAPFIMSNVQRFNQISNWVASEIVQQTVLKERVSLLEFFIRVAEESFAMQNFCTTLQIITGLQQSAIWRLKDTWPMVNKNLKKAFDERSEALKSEKNWKVHRKLVRHATPPCIPYLGMYLTDLVFIEDMATSKDAENRLNFEKSRMIAKVIYELQNHQRVPYMFESISVVRQFLLKVQPLSPKDITEASYRIIPRPVAAPVASAPLTTSTSTLNTSGGSTGTAAASGGLAPPAAGSSGGSHIGGNSTGGVPASASAPALISPAASGTQNLTESVKKSGSSRSVVAPSLSRVSTETVTFEQLRESFPQMVKQAMVSRFGGAKNCIPVQLPDPSGSVYDLGGESVELFVVKQATEVILINALINVSRSDIAFALKQLALYSKTYPELPAKALFITLYADDDVCKLSEGSGVELLIVEKLLLLPPKTGGSAVPAVDTLGTSAPRPKTGYSSIASFLAATQIPEDALAALEAVFAEHAVEPDQLRDLTSDILKEMGVRLGHAMKIMKTINELNLPQA